MQRPVAISCNRFCIGSRKLPKWGNRQLEKSRTRCNHNWWSGFFKLHSVRLQPFFRLRQLDLERLDASKHDCHHTRQSPHDHHHTTPTKRPTTATTQRHVTMKMPTWRQREQNDHNRPNAGREGQDTRKMARGGPRGDRRRDVQGTPAFLFYIINDYLTHSTPLPSPPFQNTKNTLSAQT